jgi:ribonuclease Z
MDVSSLLFGYSKALYSNWIFYKPDRLLIDCGEGAASALGNGSYGIERVLLTHGHIDHIAGLPVLLWTRAAGMGDNEKPLTIYQPAGDPYLADMERFLARTRKSLPYDLQWKFLQDGDNIPLTGQRRIQTFATQHVPNQLSLGYKIIEPRRRLKREYSHLSENEIRAHAQNGGRAAIAELMETYDAILAAFGGDGAALVPDDVRGAELLIHEATLLDAADRKNARHATLEEAVQVAARADAGVLLLHHISGRYEKPQIENATRAAATKYNFINPIWCLFHNRLWQILPDAKKEKAPSKKSTGAKP